MEIIFKNISFLEYLKDVNVHFNGGSITALTGYSALYFLDIINGDLEPSSGKIYLNQQEYQDKLYQEDPSLISYVREDYHFYKNNVYDEFIFVSKFRKYKNENLKTKILNYLTLVGLDDSILNRDITSLSDSQKVLLSIALNLIFEPKIFVLGDVFKYLDKDNLKKLFAILDNLKSLGKIIIIYSEDPNIIYSHSDNVLIFKNETSIFFGPTDKVYSSDKVLKTRGIKLPSLARITYLAKKKKIGLSYHQDIRDLIKDIYKHV